MNDKYEIQKTKYNNKYKNIRNDSDCNDIETNKEYLQNTIKSIEKMNSPKILCRKIVLSNEIIKNIKLLNEEISPKKNNDKKILNIANYIHFVEEIETKIHKSYYMDKIYKSLSEK